MPSDGFIRHYYIDQSENLKKKKIIAPHLEARHVVANGFLIGLSGSSFGELIGLTNWGKYYARAIKSRPVHLRQTQ